MIYTEIDIKVVLWDGNMKGKHTANSFTKVIFTYASIIALWIGAWVLKLTIDAYTAVFSTSWGSFLYWTFAKILIWILPSLWLIKQFGRSIPSLFNFRLWRKYLAWGSAIGSILILLNVVGHIVKQTPLLPSELTFPLINAIIIAPIFEEFTMRGAILGALRQRYSFLLANSITALLFVLLHCPGWYFMGSLWENILAPIGGALTIYIIGWLCGLAAEGGKSVLGAMLVHFVNNLTS